MTPDSLVTALQAVPLAINYDALGRVSPEPDYPALAAAVREWIKGQMPLPFLTAPFQSREQNITDKGYNKALSDVARRLGLEL